MQQIEDVYIHTKRLNKIDYIQPSIYELIIPFQTQQIIVIYLCRLDVWMAGTRAIQL